MRMRKRYSAVASLLVILFILVTLTIIQSEDPKQKEGITSDDSNDISLRDVETALIVHGFELEKADLQSGNVFIQKLNGVSPKAYFFEGRTLSIYVFPTEEARIMGMVDFENNTASTDLEAYQLFPVKNILVFYVEGKKEKHDKLKTILASLVDERTLIDLGEKDGMELLASEKTLPKDFNEIAFTREYSPHSSYLVYKVDNQKKYEEVTELFMLQEPLKKVNFEENDVFFIGVTESGSCPNDLQWVENKSGLSVLSFELTLPGGIRACTSDATPRTFVLQVSHEISGEHENVLMIQSGSETVVPIIEFN